jgi:putative FmdB family regulatory protein
MPTYEYACRTCGEHLEVVQSFTDDPLTECPSCKGELRKVFSPVGIAFKGSGFYKNDSRGGGSGGGKKGDAKPDTAGGTGDKGDKGGTKDAPSGSPSTSTSSSASSSGSGSGSTPATPPSSSGDKTAAAS